MTRRPALLLATVSLTLLAVAAWLVAGVRGDRLVSRLRDAESVTFSGTVTRLRAEAAEARVAQLEQMHREQEKRANQAVARAEDAEKERDEWMASFNTVTARVNAEQDRCATLEAALRGLLKETEPQGHPAAPLYDVGCVWCDARAALAASQPAEPMQFGAGVTSLAANLPPARVESLLDDDDFAVLDEAPQPAEPDLEREPHDGFNPSQPAEEEGT